MSTLEKAQELVAPFRYRDELPPQEQCGLGMSPRRSYADTAVVLSPEHYDALLMCRDALVGATNVMLGRPNY